MNQHWILKKENIKKLWIFSILLLASLVLIQIILPIKGHFEVEGWIGFGAWFGLLGFAVAVNF